MEKPRVIFLDAVGTLFGVKGSVGEVYSAIANQFGVTVPASALDKAFVKAFASAEPAVFPETDPEEIPQREFEWWWVIASRTFEQVGVLDQFTDFIDFFDELYAHFATGQPWLIYPDVIPALKAWQHIGIELGVVSNFDSRLHLVLKALKLEEFFSSITISTQTGFAKPDPQIFAAALEKHHCSAQEAFHIGDSFQQDYQGAQGAGLRAFLIKRKPMT
ncbi:HAD family hydrolase [Moorena sp. SIO4G3]|uniref:HAD-IA family hydrolase n=1 Tax=Moorena sp. SIO4G3 TaxID=2607821 RepID=UPI00142AD49B|nr:HAD family hydrolase [Moorena sp. SIO4G3]NEO79365.1 HAD family hydrolase [Moorena sp. SIO4G3]